MHTIHNIKGSQNMKGSQQNLEDANLWVRNTSKDELLASLLFCQHLLVAVVNLA